jgi:hypothetical protein
MRLTLAQLKEAGACSSARKRLKRVFGDAVDVTPELCQTHADEWNWGWAASNLLTVPALSDYKRAIVPALAEYKRVTAPAWDEYKRAIVPALAEYKRVTALTWDEYKRVTAPAWDEYKRVTAPALSDYKRAIAPAWANAYNSPFNEEKA